MATAKTTTKKAKKTSVVKVAKAGKPAKPAKSAKQKQGIEEAVVSPPAGGPSEDKQVIIAQFQVNQGDTGSPEVQIALLSSRIEKLISHLKTNPADNHSRRGLLGIVSKRRRLLNYLEKKNNKRYLEIAKRLGLSK